LKALPLGQRFRVRRRLLASASSLWRSAEQGSSHDSRDGSILSTRQCPQTRVGTKETPCQTDSYARRCSIPLHDATSIKSESPMAMEEPLPTPGAWSLPCISCGFTKRLHSTCASVVEPRLGGLPACSAVVGSLKTCGGVTEVHVRDGQPSTWHADRRRPEGCDKTNRW